MEEWYWHKKDDTEPRGPVNESELKELAKNGKLERKDKVWRSGFDDWELASDISMLFDTPPPIPENDNTSNYSSGNTSTIPGQNKSSSTSTESDKNSISHPKGKADEVKQTKKNNSPKSLQGVGGWLTFFCVGLTILGPLLSIGNMISGWEGAKQAFDAFPKFETAIWVENIGISIITIYGFITGAMIWSGNKKGKTLAERYLLIRLFLFIGTELLALMILSDLPQEAYSIMTDEVIVAVFREVFLFGIWFSYFKVSKRVKATYK
ncbi:GYF domain-containing protein [Fodinibius sp. SL11]|uniref:GYF domain-containing protein n=1 Tax=Fodinibius sp. SL11 TaxID=3425690 RepID=UPI003F88159A